MAGVISEMFGATSDAPANPTIGASTLAAATAEAQAYLAATLASTTPEVRRLFGEYLTQSVISQEAALALVVKKGWDSPYDPPQKQLEMSAQAAKSVLN